MRYSEFNPDQRRYLNAKQKALRRPQQAKTTLGAYLAPTSRACNRRCAILYDVEILTDFARCVRIQAMTRGYRNRRNHPLELGRERDCAKGARRHAVDHQPQIDAMVGELDKVGLVEHSAELTRQVRRIFRSDAE